MVRPAAACVVVVVDRSDLPRSGATSAHCEWRCVASVEEVLEKGYLSVCMYLCTYTCEDGKSTHYQSDAQVQASKKHGYIFTERQMASVHERETRPDACSACAAQLRRTRPDWNLMMMSCAAPLSPHLMLIRSDVPWHRACVR